MSWIVGILIWAFLWVMVGRLIEKYVLRRFGWWRKFYHEED